jgi:hypothetical protein
MDTWYSSFLIFALYLYGMIFDDELWPLSVKAMLASVLLGERDKEESEDSGYLAELAGIFREYAKTLSDLNRNEEAEEFTAKSEKILGKLAEEGNEDL